MNLQEIGGGKERKEGTHYSKSSSYQQKLRELHTRNLVQSQKNSMLTISKYSKGVNLETREHLCVVHMQRVTYNGKSRKNGTKLREGNYKENQEKATDPGNLWSVKTALNGTGRSPLLGTLKTRGS